MSDTEGMSLLAQHLRLIEGGLGGADAADRDEAGRVAGMKLRPLALEAGRRRSGARRVPAWLATASAIAAAAAFIFLLRQPTADVVLTKGDAKVFVHWERPGVFTAEVTASEASVAMMAVLDAGGALLSQEASMRDSVMELLPGERRRFASGYELDGVNEGETLSVLVCASAAFAATYADAAELAAAVVDGRVDPAAACTEFRHRLR